MNELYGPCAYLPVLMYHHVQPEPQATKLHQNSLTVYTPIFRSQMEYLKSHGYAVISVDSLLSFFNSSQPLPPKPVLLTFDDGYQDFYTDAFPILKEMGFPSVMFVPTGLIENPGYLTWQEIASLSSNRVYIGNHTWSHHNLGSPDAAANKKEISTADSQITAHGLARPVVMAYPYGSFNSSSQNYLSQIGYQASFTTRPGTIQCQKNRLQLPRLRPGNIQLTSIGL